MRCEELIPENAHDTCTAAEIAGWLGVSAHTVRRWVGKGWFAEPARLGPRKWRFSTAEVRAALARRAWDGTISREGE